MRVFLTGGTGFIGTHLVRALLKRGDECVVLTRSMRDRWRNPRVRMVAGDPTVSGAWQRELTGADVVVSLAGARLVEPPHFWTEGRKRLLRSSRIDTTRNVVAAFRETSGRPAALISASAIGVYGSRGDAVLDETAPPGNDFLAELALDWEAAARDAEDITRVTLLRTGLILSADSPILKPLLPLFRFGLGGSWGDGQQWWSWIHLADEIGMILFAIDNEIAGPLNLTAPHPVKVHDFANTLAGVLNRPALFRAPGKILRLALGEMADTLLGSQRVVPKRAVEAGYQFQFPDLKDALADLL